jgi:hypothetical protein
MKLTSKIDSLCHSGQPALKLGLHQQEHTVANRLDSLVGCLIPGKFMYESVQRAADQPLALRAKSGAERSWVTLGVNVATDHASNIPKGAAPAHYVCQTSSSLTPILILIQTVRHVPCLLIFPSPKPRIKCCLQLLFRHPACHRRGYPRHQVG